MKWLLGLMALLLVSCEGIDCTLNNVVYCNYAFYSSSSGEAIALTDTLTVTAYGTDSVLYNKGVSTSTLSVPMSYDREADTLVFSLCGESYTFTSYVTVSKTNTPHNESPDCPTTMFHLITDATVRSVIIDSVVVKRATVNYLTDENIRVYFAD